MREEKMKADRMSGPPEELLGIYTAYQQAVVFDYAEDDKMGKAVLVRYIMWGDVSLSADVGGGGQTVKQYLLALKITDVESHRIVYRDVESARLKSVD